MAFTYPPGSGAGGGLTAAELIALQIDPDAAALYYTSRTGKSGSAQTGWFKTNILTPIMFNRDMTVTAFATRFNSIPNVGAMPNGADIWYHLYEGVDTDTGNKPANLIADAGRQNITDATGANATFVKTLASPVVLDANTTYWIGRAWALSDGAGGTADGSGPTYRVMTDAGHNPTASTGVTESEISFAHTGFVGYYAQDIQDATWGTAPATLTGDLYPQPFATVSYIKGEPV
jgi:hypothetical protein